MKDMEVYLVWRNGVLDIVSLETGETLEIGIVCLAYAESFATSKGWTIVNRDEWA